jgi:hypothetical protein
MPSIEANPQYAAALKQKEDAQKQYMTLAPHIIDAKAKASLAAYNAGNAAARIQYKATTDMQRTAYDATMRRADLAMQDKAAMARVIQDGANQQRDIMARAEAAMGVTANPALNAEVKQHLGNVAIAQLDTAIDTISKNRDARDTAEKTGTPAQQAASQAKNAVLDDFDRTRLAQLAAQRANMQAEFFPGVTGNGASAAGGVRDAGAITGPTTPVIPVGNDTDQPTATDTSDPDTDPNNIGY